MRFISFVPIEGSGEPVKARFWDNGRPARPQHEIVFGEDYVVTEDNRLISYEQLIEESKRTSQNPQYSIQNHDPQGYEACVQRSFANLYYNVNAGCEAISYIGPQAGVSRTLKIIANWNPIADICGAIYHDEGLMTIARRDCYAATHPNQGSAIQQPPSYYC